MPNKEMSKARQFNRLLAEIDTVYHEIAQRQGFSDSAMSILYALADNDGKCRLTDLIKLTLISKQTVNSALRKLESEGIVYLESIGGKAKQVCLTQKGLKIAENTVNKILKTENKIYSSWSDEQWQLYLSLTRQFLRDLKKETEEILQNAHSTF